MVPIHRMKRIKWRRSLLRSSICSLLEVSMYNIFNIKSSFSGNAGCDSGQTEVTLNDDYFSITPTNLTFDGAKFKGDKNADVSFLIKGRNVA